MFMSISIDFYFKALAESLLDDKLKDDGYGIHFYTFSTFYFNVSLENIPFYGKFNFVKIN